jgi:hypothetical protein
MSELPHSTREDKLFEQLRHIGTQMCDKLESIVHNYPDGVCYLLGHCLAEGLSQAGFTANSVTGHFIFKNKHYKNIVYGSHRHKGMNIGDYHTWCVLTHNDEEIIIDPSIRFDKNSLPRLFGIKLHPSLPDVIVTDKPRFSYYEYIADERLTPLSLGFLHRTHFTIKDRLIETVREHSAQLAAVVIT